MKLYHFNPNDYGQEFFVMSQSKEQAHSALMSFFRDMIKKEKSFGWIYEGELERWQNVNPSDKTTYPDKYTLEEYESNQVIQSEIA